MRRGIVFQQSKYIWWYNPQSSYSNGASKGAIITSASSASTLVGYVNGQPYYGEFHLMPNGNKEQWARTLT